MLTLGFDHQEAETAFLRVYHSSSWQRDKTWAKLHSGFLLAMVVRVCSGATSLETQLLFFLMIPRSLSLLLAFRCKSKDAWAHIRPAALAFYKLWGAVACVSALFLDLHKVPSSFIRPSLVDAFFGECLHAVATPLPFKQHLPLQVAVVVVKVLISILPRIGLCAVLDARVDTDAHCAATARALRLMHDATSQLALWVMSGGGREPHNYCCSVAAFYTVLLSLAVPMGLLYLRERSERRAFLQSLEQQPEEWLAHAPVDPLLALPTLSICTILAYPLCTMWL